MENVFEHELELIEQIIETLFILKGSLAFLKV